MQNWIKTTRPHVVTSLPTEACSNNYTIKPKPPSFYVPHKQDGSYSSFSVSVIWKEKLVHCFSFSPCPQPSHFKSSTCHLWKNTTSPRWNLGWVSVVCGVAFRNKRKNMLRQVFVLWGGEIWGCGKKHGALVIHAWDKSIWGFALSSHCGLHWHWPHQRAVKTAGIDR